MLLGSALCCWVLPCAAGFCLVLLGSALCCWVLPCAAGFCLVLLGSALCCWVLPCASRFCLLLLGSACLCCVNARCPQCAQYFACRLPLHVIQPSDFTFREFAAARARISFASRFDLVFDLVFPGLDFLVLSPSLPFFGCSLVSLVGALAFLLLSSLGRCCWWMFAAVGLSLCLVVVSCLCLSSAAGWERVKKTITLLRVIPTMTFIRFVTGKSSGILSDISFLAFYLAYLLAFYLANIPALYLAYLVAFYLAYLLAYLLTSYLAFYLANLLAFYLANILALYLAIPCGILSGISSGILSVISIWHSIYLSGVLSGISSGILSDMLSGVLSGISSGILSGR